MRDSFVRTTPLSLVNHPESEASWPTWAAVAMVHTLADLGPEIVNPDRDLYVTYSSHVENFASSELRCSIDGVEIDVLRLFVWDWGPVELDVKAVVSIPDDTPTIRLPELQDECIQ